MLRLTFPVGADAVVVVMMTAVSQMTGRVMRSDERGMRGVMSINRST